MQNKKGNAAVIAIIVVIVAVSASVITWLVATKTQAPEKQTSAVQTAMPLLTPNKTENWKLYANNKYGYQFKYPGDAEYVNEVQASEFGPQHGASRNNAYWEEIYKKYTGQICVNVELKGHDGNMTISAPENNENNSFKYIECGTSPSSMELHPDYVKLTKSTENIEIDGQKYKMDVYNSQSSYPGNNMAGAISLSDGTIIELSSTSENWSTVRQMAQSYHKSNVSPANADWKTYMSKYYGFSVDYPSSWPILEIDPSECSIENFCSMLFGRNEPIEISDQTESDFVSPSIGLIIISPQALKNNNGNDGSLSCTNAKKISLTSGYILEKKQCLSAMDGSIEIYYTFDNNGWKYQFVRTESQKEKDVLDKMLSSFKIIRD